MRNYIIVAIVSFLIGSSTTYIIGATHNRSNTSIGRESSTAAEVNRAIGDEQQLTLDGVRGAIETVERVRSITAETDSTLQQLRELNRGSSSLSTQIREEAYILENYFNSISNIVSNDDRSNEWH